MACFVDWCHSDLHLADIIVMGCKADAVRRHRIRSSLCLGRRAILSYLPADDFTALRLRQQLCSSFELKSGRNGRGQSKCAIGTVAAPLNPDPSNAGTARRQEHDAI